mmetsp:Transcript_13963/g.23202  ORF Transcript_13963/g.23202 Transcript_13963/m.23202 type:complete len:265 (-) Transcript_13963:142-936(-)|eukprot:CAMPEP_0119012814 /NCGR_PEP_ID=MMETSP1176-20130426/7640_1 /TAXON_ID=265551 /ORGANISM="Synedropsis recta cf, Strain CCMP1620" /LENGTH=264 /DNA_ID=CAMNT_0006965845 /DNA_START=74 /DNA_END=868 /DNA_ORIENTATION=-
MKFFNCIVALALAAVAQAQNGNADIPEICQAIEDKKAQGVCNAWERAGCVTPDDAPCSTFSKNYLRVTGEFLPQLTADCLDDLDCGFTGVSCVSNTCVTDNCSLATRSCCVNTDCAVDKVCEFVSGFCLNKGNPRFTLTWTGEDDIDLWVFTPGGQVVGWKNKYEGVSGGRLDRDDTGDYNGGIAPRAENIIFPLDGSAPTGIYSVYVRTYSARGAGPDNWTLAVYIGTQLKIIQPGTGTANDRSSPTLSETPLLTFEFLGLMF